MARIRPPLLEPEGDRETRDRPVSWAWRVPLILLLPTAAATPLVAAGREAAVEQYYSRGVYPYVSSLLGLVSDSVPFSVGEVLLLVLVGWVALRSFRALADVVRGTRSVGNVSLHFLAGTMTLVGALVGGWLFAWGLNYQRMPFSSSADLPLRPADAGELAALCEELVAEAAEVRGGLPLDAEGVVSLRTERDECLARVATGFRLASKRYPLLEWNYARPKQALLSPLLSRLGVTGIYSPLTGEPYVNAQLTDCELPFTASHELAHQIGFAREDEANFLAWLACRAHPDPDFRYSGATEALVHALNALAATDPEAWARVAEAVPEGVRRDLEANAANWLRFDSPAREVARTLNDAYLKSAGEEEGVASYGGVVDLMLAERRRDP